MRTENVAIAIASLFLTSCASATLPAGRHQVAAAVVRPSSDAATSNATAMLLIHEGQSRADVLGIMRHQAERHEVTGVTESWGYLTSGPNRMLTWITFTDQKVSSISHEQLIR